MNLNITKLSIEELKIFKKFNREFLPKIKKLDFNFTDMKKGELMYISTPKDIIKFIKKIPSKKKYNFKDIRLKLAKKNKADNTCPVTFGIFLRLAIEYSLLEIKYLKLECPNFPFWRVEYDKKSNVYKKIKNFKNLLKKYDGY
tara:strand:+ start:90 stop:518 length:429 start_codon:yes stop_codon:yes gene_type:complete